MYKSIALEVAQRNIRFNIIAPGFIKTPMTDKLNDAQTETILKKIPMNRFGSPNDVANLVAAQVTAPLTWDNVARYRELWPRNFRLGASASDL